MCQDKSIRTVQTRPTHAENFCSTLSANVDNVRLSDADFRSFVRDSLPVVQFPVRWCKDCQRAHEETDHGKR